MENLEQDSHLDTPVVSIEQEFGRGLNRATETVDGYRVNSENAAAIIQVERRLMSDKLPLDSDDKKRLRHHTVPLQSEQIEQLELSSRMRETGSFIIRLFGKIQQTHLLNKLLDRGRLQDIGFVQELTWPKES